MIYLFYLILTVGLVVLQTVVMPALTLPGGMYDLLLPFVIFAGLFRPLVQGLPVVILLGFLMDGLSAGPFGLYLTTYLWLFAGTRWLTRFFHAHSSSILFLSVAVAVLVEHAIWLMSTVFLGGSAVRLPEFPLRAIFSQVLWALVTGPFFLVGYRWVHRWVDHRPE